MHDQPLAIWARARRLLDAFLIPASRGPAVPLGVRALHVHGEPITAAEARAATFEPFAIGDPWGAAWDTTWMRLQGTVPDDWRGQEVVARIDLGYRGQPGFGAEALLWRGDLPVQGISPEHGEVRVACPARGGEVVDLLVEASAIPHVDQRAASWPPLHPDPGGRPLLRLDRAEICTARRDVEALCHELRLTLDLSQRLGGTGARAGALLQALQQACSTVDPEDLEPTVEPARDVLRDALCAEGAPRRHRVVAEAHAHIDTAWLWPIHETRRKCARSFSTVVSLMDEYPEMRFACSQVQHYAWMRDSYPELFARIRERVEDGRWEPVGGMWVESDCNLAAAESLVRQVVHGKLFMLEELGVESEVAWLPDSFGFPATLPQILREGGMRWFVTQKISWNQVDVFPHSTFWWEGLDGSRVLAHFPPVATYNGDVSVAEVARSEEQFLDHGVASSSLYPYGLGDGGGGPTREMLERARRLADVDGLPRLEHGTAREFFERTEAESGELLATWRGELYLERHRGVFTSQGRMKRDNRESERLLREAETWSCMLPAGWRAYPHAELDEAWKLTLLHQFHDILPGSSIAMVYDDARRDHARVHEIAGRAISAATRAIADVADSRQAEEPVIVFNAATNVRREVVELPGQQPRLAIVDAPGCGYAVHDAAVTAQHVQVVDTQDDCIDNGVLRVTWDEDGLLTSVYDHQAQREVIALGARGNLLQLFRDHPTDFDAWEIDAGDLRTPMDLTAADSVEVVERHPLRGAVKVTRSFGRSRVEQVLRLSAGSRRIEVETTVDWREDHRLLKAAFPVAVHSARASFDVGFGHVERPTHENTSWDAAMFEVPAHRFADLSEQGYGVALLNDCKHGYDVRGNVLRVTLLRAPTAPDPTADRGVHRFRYALLPHEGDLVEGRVTEEAEAFDLPLRLVPASRASDAAPALPATASVVTVEGYGVAVTAVKKAERGDAMVVRVCEVAGGRGIAVVRVALPVSGASLCDLLERPRQRLAVDGGGVRVPLDPFRLATLRFETA